MTVLHTLNIHQKPKLGTAFIRRDTAYNYNHSISAVGGYDTASCDIAVRNRDEGMYFLEQFIGNRVAVYVDNPAEPIWEGFINRLTFDWGGVQQTVSLDDMYNSIRLHWTTAAGGLSSGTAAGNVTSQNIYGVKQGTVDVGFYFLAGSARPDAMRDALVNQRAWPQSSIVKGGSSGLVHIEMLGFYHTLKWQLFTSTSTTTRTYFNQITLVLLPLLSNGTTFFDNTDFTDISANATNTAEGDPAKTIWDALINIQASGDGSGNQYIMGITPTIPTTGTRRLYYRTANNDIEYIAYASDGLRIRNIYGRLVDPWRVQPDRGIRITDLSPAFGLPGDDPRETYINTISYDANAQTATYYGYDDITLEGMFALKNNRPAWLARPFQGRIRIS